MEKIPVLCRVFHSSSALKLPTLGYENFPKVFPRKQKSSVPIGILHSG